MKHFEWIEGFDGSLLPVGTNLARSNGTSAMAMGTLNQAYHYKTGDRPLEGFVIQRGVGRGAFGEVFYALSDSGREVALKSVLGYEQIELRGVSQCMNLKSPYLVSIFDIRQNERGQSFVVMEYVAGPSLRDLLNESPSGLGPQKTAFFLREIAKGLAYLHDRGIVHRDLKPGNIFYEDGYVKIGDYGLSKAMAPSQHSGQTITVGTVHYMAPEIGQGRYDKSIDIYALGVLVFEMLTGHVPFFGASHGEILMKHLMEEPDLSGIEEPFATVVRKAMAKDPGERYQSVQEMVEAVFGAEHIAQSVSVFRPDSLSMVAERVARNVIAGGPGSSADLANDLRVDRPVAQPRAEDGSDVWLDFGRKMEQVTDRFQKATEDFATRTRTAAERLTRPYARTGADAPREPTRGDALVRDPMTRRQRRILAVATAAVIGLGTAFLSGSTPDFVFLAVALGTLGGTAGLGFAHWYLLPRAEAAGGNVARRLVLGVPAFIGLFFGSAPALLGFSGYREDRMAASFAAMGLILLIVRWDKVMSRSRPERVVLGHAIFAGILAAIFAGMFEGYAIMAMGMMAGLALVAQIASPFAPGAARAAVQAGASGNAGQPDKFVAPPPSPGSPAYSVGVGPASSRSDRQGAGPTRAGKLKHRSGQESDSLSYQAGVLVGQALTSQDRTAPIAFRIVWLCVLTGVFGLGLFCAIASGWARGDEAVLCVGGAIGCGLAVIRAIIELRRKEYYGVWGNLIKPLISMVSLGVAVLCGVALTDARPGTDYAYMLAFFAAFPAAIWLVLLFVPRDMFGQPAPRKAAAKPKPHAAGDDELDRGTAILLSCLAVFGVFGLQRFYVGKIGTGLLYLCTGGLLLVGQVYDFFLLISGEFTDQYGRKLRDTKSSGLYPPQWKVSPAPAASPVAQAGMAAADEPVGASPPRPLAEDEGVHQPQVHTAQSFASSRSGGREVSPFVREPRRTSLVLSALAYAFLIPGVLIGVVVAFQLPSFAAVGMPFPELGRELGKWFDYAGWPGLVTRIGTVVSVCLLIVAALLLAIARREAGVGHVSRAVLAVIGLFVAGTTCSGAFFRLKWLDLIGDGPQLQKLETVMNQVDSVGLLLGAGLLLASTVLMVWPERRRTLTTDGSVREGVAA